MNEISTIEITYNPTDDCTKDKLESYRTNDKEYREEWLPIYKLPITKEKLNDFNIDLIICSPMKRTNHTCDIINVNKIPLKDKSV